MEVAAPDWRLQLAALILAALGAFLLLVAAEPRLRRALGAVRRLVGRHGDRSTRSGAEGRPPAASQNDLRLYARLVREARPWWPHMGAILLVNLLAAPIALLLPLPLKIALDTVVGSDPLPTFLDPLVPDAATRSDAAVLVLAASMVVAVALLDQLQKLGDSVLGTYTGEKLQLGFRSRLFRHVQRLSLSYHDSRGTADSLYRIEHDAPSIQWIAVYGVTPLFTSGLTLLAMIYVTFRVSWQLAVVALAVSPVLLLLMWASRWPLRNRWREAKRLESSALSVVQEVLTGLRVVKAFAQEEREHDRFLRHSGAGMRARIRLSLIEGGFAMLIGLTMAAGTALVLFIGVRQVQTGTLTIGELVLVMG